MVYFNEQKNKDVSSLVAAKVGIDSFDSNVIGDLLFSYIDDGIYYFDIITIVRKKVPSSSGYLCLKNIELTNYTVEVDHIDRLDDLVTGDILYDPYGILKMGKKMIASKKNVPFGSNQIKFSSMFQENLINKIKDNTFEGPMNDLRILKKFLLAASFYNILLNRGLNEEQLLNIANRRFLTSDQDYNCFALAYACYKSDSRFSNCSRINEYQKKMK